MRGQRERWRRRRRWCTLVGVVVAVAAGSSVEAGVGDGELIDVDGGRRIFLQCAGEGSPTVIFESGYPNNGEVWSAGGVFQAVSGFTRACVYDRPGTGWQDDVSRSDAAPQPRTAADIVGDLHALLQASGEPGPYVLVAHSIGGLFSRLYASTYPNEVVGMVLVDTTSEYQIERLAPITPPAFEDVLYISERPSADTLAAYPQVERILINDSSAQVRDAQANSPLRPMPLVVLTHGIPLAQDTPLPAGFPAAAWQDVLVELQRELAHLVPDARQVIATGSGHYIQLQRPDLVIDAVRAVVDAVRQGELHVDPGALPVTGGSSTRLVTIGSILTATGIGLRTISRRGIRRTRPAPRFAR